MISISSLLQETLRSAVVVPVVVVDNGVVVVVAVAVVVDNGVVAVVAVVNVDVTEVVVSVCVLVVWVALVVENVLVEVVFVKVDAVELVDVTEVAGKVLEVSVEVLALVVVVSDG